MPFEASRGVLSAARRGTKPRLLFLLPFVFCLLPYASAPASAQQLLDRVLARIGTEAITQTDVQTLVEFGLIDATSPTDPAAVRQAIERQLVLREVARFPPPESPVPVLEQQLAAMRARVGDRLEAVMRANGVDEARLLALARDALRIRQYVDQRFALSTQVSEEEARKYFEGHRDRFTRNGEALTFEQAATEARQGALAERQTRAVAQWLQDLRARSEVVLVTP
jgi:hypothetical protein